MTYATKTLITLLIALFMGCSESPTGAVDPDPVPTDTTDNRVDPINPVDTINPVDPNYRQLTPDEIVDSTGNGFFDIDPADYLTNEFDITFPQVWDTNGNTYLDMMELRLVFNGDRDYNQDGSVDVNDVSYFLGIDSTINHNILFEQDRIWYFTYDPSVTHEKCSSAFSMISMTLPQCMWIEDSYGPYQPINPPLRR